LPICRDRITWVPGGSSRRSAERRSDETNVAKNSTIFRRCDTVVRIEDIDEKTYRKCDDRAKIIRDDECVFQKNTFGIVRAKIRVIVIAISYVTFENTNAGNAGNN